MKEHEKHGPVDWLNWSISRVAMWLPAFIVLIIFYEVFMRYVLFRPTLWVNEMSLWLGGAIYVTAGLYAMQQRSHIRIFVLYDMAPSWMRKLFDFLSALCVCVFVFAVIWGGYGEALAKLWRWETFGTAFDPPIPATNKPLILGTLFVLALQAVSNLIRDWPAAATVRKAFDIIAAVSVVGLCIVAFPALFSGEEAGLKMPTHWRIGIGLGLLIAMGLIAIGLIRDFGRPAVPYTGLDDDDLIDELAIEAGQTPSDTPSLSAEPKQD